MNLFDLLVIVLAVAAAIGGYRLGFLTRVISWIGLGLGVMLAVAILPGLMRRVDDGSNQTMVLLAVATLLGCSLVGQGIGLAIGSRLHIALPDKNARQVDRVAGGTLGVIGVLVAVWLLIPTLASVPGSVSEQVRGSYIAQRVHDVFPAVPDSVQDLRRVVGDSFPEVFDGMATAPDPGPPPVDTGITAEVDARIRQSTVKVRGEACSRVQEGSGFFVESSGAGGVTSNLVVTNAHVVAGESQTQVLFNGGGTANAAVVAYDSQRDLAVLLVDGPGRPSLPLQDATPGDRGAVYGHPGGGNLERSPFEISDRINAVGTDIYDRQRSERQVLVLASNLAPGDSGAALVDPESNVIGVAFAIAPDRPDVAYALDLSELRAVMQGSLNDTVNTGGCLV